jgi:hypothetical protein
MPRCKNCREKFTPKRFLQKHCENCKEAEREYQSGKMAKTTSPKKPINKVSDKRKVENIIYTSNRIKFLMKPENKICFIDECRNPATTIEHSAGRTGFYDDWARENNISLYLDQRFWKPCCHAHNLELENNPELSKKYQLSKIHGGEKL